MGASDGARLVGSAVGVSVGASEGIAVGAAVAMQLLSALVLSGCGMWPSRHSQAYCSSASVSVTHLVVAVSHSC